MADISFVRSEMLAQQAPPASSVGVLGWMRANLFAGWANSILTLIALYVVFSVLANRVSAIG